MPIATGLIAAIPTPVDADGRVDENTLDRIVDFVVQAGVRGICIGGATGEYPHFETGDRKAVVNRAARRLPSDRALFVGIGASSLRRTIDLGKEALAAGSRGVLLPMPMFFRYEQEDLAAYCVEVGRAVAGPCLLYDLPDFTNGLSAETAVSLLERGGSIVGIKDSSGRPENIAAFAGARGMRDWTLFVGDDRLLASGIRAGWNGGISGIAAFCPELLVSLERSARSGDEEQTQVLQALLEEVIGQIAVFPTPWGIRIALAARGIDTGPLPLPIGAGRARQIAAFQAWFTPWLERARERCEGCERC